MFDHILLCTDGSENALRAAAAAIDIAQKFHSHITLISVFNPAPALAIPVTGGPGLVPYVDAGVIQEICDEFHMATEKAAVELLNNSNLKYQTKQGFGHPVDEIVSAAEAQDVNLIVLGSRGMGDFKRFLIGSISDGVLHHAHCPVLIIR